MYTEKTLPVETPRIEFFDLAKGVCISLIMMLHMNINLGIPQLESMRIPLYYVLSGLFFKEYSGFCEFLIRKTNNILIPLFFFYLLSFLLNHLYYRLDLTGTVPYMHISDLFTRSNFYNVALWFLLSLFWANILFYLIHHFLQKEWLRLLIVIFFAVSGYCLRSRAISLPLFLSPTCTALIFFYVGYLLKKTPFIYKHRYDKYCLPAAALLILIAFLLPVVSVDLRINLVKGNSFVFYFVSLCMVAALLLVCKQVKRLPVLSYLGRYSIIVLGTHTLLRDPFFLLYGVILKLGLYSAVTAWLSWISVVLIMFLIIPFCRKCLPYVTAQKNLIPLPVEKNN